MVPALRRAQYDDHTQTSEHGSYTPTELPLWTENDSQEQQSAEDDKQEPLLELPAPAPPHGKPHEFEYIKLRLWNMDYPLTQTTAKFVLRKSIKVVLLVLKVSYSHISS